MKINHQIFYQGSVNLHKVQFGWFGFSEDDWQSLVHPSKVVLRSNLPKSRKYWSADYHVAPYLGRCLTFCSRITQPWFLLILPIEYGIWYCRERFSTFEHLWFVPSWFWSENWFLISNLHCILLWTHVELLFLNSNRYPKWNFSNMIRASMDGLCHSLSVLKCLPVPMMVLTSTQRATLGWLQNLTGVY